MGLTSCNDVVLRLKHSDDSTSIDTLKLYAAGGRHNCVLKMNNDFYCWGKNNFGQIGNSLSDEVSVKSPLLIENFLSSSEKIVTLSLAYTHSCLLTNIGNVFCWGNNSSGGVGISQSVSKVYSPVMIDLALPSEDKVLSISAGGHHSCAITSGKEVFCWGNNNKGQLGVNSVDIFRDVPSLVDQTNLASDEYFIDLKLAFLHSCGITNLHRVYCWGSNQNGELGNGSSDPLALLPTLVDVSMLDFDDEPAKIFSGYYSNCFISKKNKSYCWGSNMNGSLGLGTIGGTYPLPEIINDFSTPQNYFTSFSLGFYFNCGVTNLGKVYCWGRNNSGQLGDGSLDDRSSPTPVDTSLSFRSVRVGDYHSCAESTSGKMLCWGSNNDGQLGLGNSASSSSPLPVSFSAKN